MMGQTLKNQIRIISGPDSGPPPAVQSREDLKTVEEAIAEYKALLNSVPEAVIRKAWFTMSHLVLPPGSKIVDMGSSDGSMIFAMAVMNPDYNFIAIDQDRHLIRQSRDLYKLKNLEFTCGNMMDENILPEASVDAIIHSFVQHEIYTQTACNERIVQNMVENHFRFLKPEGLLFIREFSLKETAYVLLEFPDENRQKGEGVFGLSEPELLIQYSEKARPREDDSHRGFYLEELPPRFPQTRLFRLPYKWAYEFLLRKDDREYWDEELHKEYAFLTERDMRRMLKAIDARLLYSAPHWDQQIVKARFEKKFKMFDELGNPMGNPPTSFVTLAQKVGERRSLILSERKPSRTPTKNLRITAMRDDTNGRIQDVVCRDQEIVELIPYRIENNKLSIFIHDGLPRALVNTVPRHGPNIDGKRWSGHMTEAVSIPLEVFNAIKPGDTKSTFNFAKDFLGLRITPGRDIEDGPGFYPAPDHIDERIQTKYLQVQAPEGPITPRHILSEISGFSTQGKIREVDAQRILNAIGVGLIPSSRLEIQILALYEKLDMPYEAWADCPLSIKTEEPEVTTRMQELVDKMAQHDHRFREIRGTGGQMRTSHSIFVDEGQIKGGITGLASREIEFMLQEDKSQNTAVILPLTRGLNGEVMAGIIEDYLPVPQRYQGNGYIISCPSFTLPKEITNFELARKYIAEKFEVNIDCVSRMGESYFSHIGITPQRIYPFAVSTAGTKGWRKVGRGHGTTSYTPLKNVWKLLYNDTYDSFMKVAAYAMKATTGSNSDLSPSASFERKLADIKAVPIGMKSSGISSIAPANTFDRDH